MPVISAYHAGDVKVQIDNPYIDPGMFELDPINLKSGAPVGWPWNVDFAAPAGPLPARVIEVSLAKLFSYDYFYRVHVVPQRIELGTISSPQTRIINVWNAWPYTTAALADVTPTPAEGVVIEGQATPYVMKPMQELNYSVTIGTSGPPGINVAINFNFTDVPDPSPVVFIGTRAVRFGVVPEVPVREEWEWLTDLMTATDGSEQRVAVRGEAPRVSMDFTAVFDSQEDIRDFYAQALTVKGRLWVPEYQYATATTADAAQGDSVIYVNQARTDIRDGEYVVVDNKESVAMVQVLTVGAGSLLLAAPLDFPLPKGSLVCPGSPCILQDGLPLKRYRVNEVAETTMAARLQRYRETLTRPGIPDQLPMYLGSKVLTRRPLAPSMVEDAFFTGQELQDNRTGVFDVMTLWDYTRIAGKRQFKINRVQQPNEMDYWREFCAWCRGMVRMFWMSTYRPDVELFVPMEEGANFATFIGADYAQKVYTIPTHRHIEFATAAGSHYAEVTNVVVDVLGNSYVNFTPALPTGAGWTTIERISFLLPLRLNDDTVTLLHYGLETLLELSIRTAEDQL